MSVMSGLHLPQVTWLMHMCDVIYSYVRRDWFICATCVNIRRHFPISQTQSVRLMGSHLMTLMGSHTIWGSHCAKPCPSLWGSVRQCNVSWHYTWGPHCEGHGLAQWDPHIVCDPMSVMGCDPMSVMRHCRCEGQRHTVTRHVSHNSMGWLRLVGSIKL